MSEDGLEAIARLAEEGIKTNCTLIFSANQGLPRGQGRGLAAVAVRRSTRRHQPGRHGGRARARRDGRTYDLDTEVLAASIRSPRHMTEAALAGAHIATVPLKVLRADDPSPADRQGHRAVPQGLGGRAVTSSIADACRRGVTLAPSLERAT